MDVDTLAVVVKAVAYASLLQGAGIALFIAMFGARLQDSAGAIRRLGLIVCGVSLVAVLACYLVEAGRMMGEVSGIVDFATQRRLAHLPLAAASTLRLLGAGLVIGGLAWKASEATVLAVTGAVVVAGSFLLLGHTVSHEPRWAIVALLQLHLLVAAFWIGSIVPLILVARRETAIVAYRIVERFSALAMVLVPAMVMAGLLMAWLLVGERFSLRDPYSASLAGKVVLLILALILAALNRARLGPALRGGDGPSVRRFTLSLATELVILLGIVALTATMTSLFSPPMGGMS